MTEETFERAKAFGREAHDSIQQKRKYSGAPYWVHTEAVAEIARVHGANLVLRVALLLHDVVEDVFPVNPVYSLSRIEAEFGPDVALIVDELTDKYTKAAYPELNRKARHALENQRLAKISPLAKDGKLCDLTHNTGDIVAQNKGFARVYLREKQELLPFLLGGTDYELWKLAFDSMQSGFAILNDYECSNGN